MPKILVLTTKQRDELLTHYRMDPDPEARFRAHILLLLGEGQLWNTIEAMLCCSCRTVDSWLKRFQAEGLAGFTGWKGRLFRMGGWWVAVLTYWVTTMLPSAFGFLRSRWSCALLALLLHERHDVMANRETVRRMLRPGQPGLPAAPPGPATERGTATHQVGRVAGTVGEPFRRRDGGLAG